MVNRNLIRNLDLNEEGWESELAEAMQDIDEDQLYSGGATLTTNSIIQGTILRVEGDFVLVDVGYKSEGAISLREWVGQVQEGRPFQNSVARR